MDTVSGMSLEALSADQLKMIVYILGTLGLLYCFAGYKLFRFILALTGFLVAGSVAGVLSGWLSTGDVVVMLVCGLFGGLCGALALTFVYKLGVFGLGSMAAILVCQQVSMDMIDAPMWFILVCAGLLGGIVALVLERPAMTLATAAIGAWLSSIAAYVFILGVDTNKLAELGDTLGASPQNTMWLLAGWFALALAGAAVQFRSSKKQYAS